MARNRLVLSGVLGSSGAEAWSCGITYGTPGQPLAVSPSDLQQWASNVATYLISLAATHPMKAWLSSAGSLTKVNTYHYSGAGPATASGEQALSPVAAGGGAINLPFQCARVVTLRTAQAGRRFRGRIYYPVLNATMASTGKAATSQGNVDEFKTALVAMGAAAPTVEALKLGVYSTVLDVVTPVTSISVGDVIDTQRRRRDALVEVRLNSAL